MVALNRKYQVKILGGCCGTRREHLRYLTRHIDRGFAHTLTPKFVNV
jgi:methionine synthase I (cobalamin-dependent)